MALLESNAFSEVNAGEGQSQKQKFLSIYCQVPVSPQGPVNRLPESQMSRLPNSISRLKLISVRNRWCHLCAYFRSDSIGLFLLFYLGAAFRLLVEFSVTLLRKLLASLVLLFLLGQILEHRAKQSFLKPQIIG